ncbi:MFS transporter [Candidatus Acetothermia bacterium]|nr:MFS transporter [Candidatus Acetothermia bacterium]MBI3644260.1 MFS transporter [Candidatus Acetothermia bacterium]
MNRKTWIVMICGGAILSVVLGMRQSFGLFLAPITSDLHIGREVFALAMGLMNLLWGLGSPFAGAIADRFGPGKVAAAGGAFYAAGLWMMSQSHSGDQLLLAGILLGIGLSGAGFSVILGAVGRASSPEHRTKALAIVSLGGSVGQFLSIPGVSLLLAGNSWVLSLGIMFAVSLIAIPLSKGVAGLTAKSSTENKQTLGEALREAFHHQSFWLLTSGFFVCGFHLAFIGVHFPAYLHDHGFPPGLSATALLLIGLFNIVGTYFCGLLGGKFLKKNVLSIIYLVRAAIFLVFLVSPLSDISVVLFSIGIGTLWLGTVPLTSGLIAYIFGPAYMSMLYGIVFLSHQIGGFAGSWLAGYLYDHVGSYDAMWLINVALGVMSSALHWPIRERPVERLQVKPNPV